MSLEKIKNASGIIPFLALIAISFGQENKQDQMRMGEQIFADLDQVKQVNLAQIDQEEADAFCRDLAQKLELRLNESRHIWAHKDLNVCVANLPGLEGARNTGNFFKEATEDFFKFSRDLINGGVELGKEVWDKQAFPIPTQEQIEEALKVRPSDQ